MKEDIKYLQRFIDKCKLRGYEFYGILHPPHFEMLENLITKYKEQKRDIRASHILLAKYSQKIEEQEKVIELMAEYIDFDKIDLNCTSLCVKDNCREQCIIDYFKKKARKSNDK